MFFQLKGDVMAEKIGSVLLLLVLFSSVSSPTCPWAPDAVVAQQTESSTTPVAEAEATDIGSAPDQKAIDNLERFLVGSSWKGTFTITGQTEKLIPEAYEIVSAEKEPTGDEWMLVAKIKYGKKDVKVPVGLSIKWVDRTPMIVLDQVPIPGMGTFDARVIIRRGMYAGTWAHGEKGGHLFGEITTAASKDEKEDDGS